MPESAHLEVARSAAIACAVEVLWLRIVCARRGLVSIDPHDVRESFELTLVEYDASPVMREYRIAAPNAPAVLSLEGLVGSEHYL